MNACKTAVAASLAAALLAGCRTTKDVLDDYERNISVGAYDAPAAETRELAAKAGGDRLLWQLMAGGALYMADRRDDAVAMFDAAEDRMHENDITSVFAKGGEGALAMMSNDKAFAYDGGGQDRIFTCLYKAIDYMASGQTGAARTELNRAAEHQENWLWERRKDIAAASDRLKEEADAYAKKHNDSNAANRDGQTAAVLADASFAAQIRENCGFDPATSGDLDAMTRKDWENPYADHVRATFRSFAGDQGAKPSNKVVVYAEDGLCPCREEWRIDLPLVLLPFVGRYAPYAGMALPKLRERAHGAVNWSVSAGGQTFPMALLADVDALEKTEYDVYMRGALTREITRTIAKVGVQVALGVTADSVSDSRTRMALKLSQYAAAGWAYATTAADLRSWTALPKTVKAVVLDRPADGVLTIVADGQGVQVSLPPGNAMVFVRKPGPSAAPTVKVASFR